MCHRLQGLGQEQSAVSHNLKKLLVCNCVHIEVQGKNRYYSLNDDTIVPLLQLADQAHSELLRCSMQTVRSIATGR